MALCASLRSPAVPEARRVARAVGYPVAMWVATVSTAFVAVVFFSMALPCCAPAHRATHGPGEVDALLSQAAVERARRDLDGAHRAAVLYLAAAAADDDRVEGLVGAARVRVWLAERESGPRARLEAAEGAVHAAEWCLRIEPEQPSCHYWLGVGLGLQARERPSLERSAMPRITEAFERAERTEPTLEEAGPDRALALLHLRARPEPSGPGDPGIGLEHARRAVKLRPKYPPNQLALAEALQRMGDDAGSREAYRVALELAREREESGDPDAPDWIEKAGRGLADRGGS